MLFEGLGKAAYVCEIKLKPNGYPVALSLPGRIPVPLQNVVEEQLKKMENKGVISRVRQQTSWCSPVVVVPKKNGDVRICVDYTSLIKSVLREYHPIPSVEPVLATLGQVRIFSHLDAYSGFYQIKLHPESTLLTTFITPFGQYKLN